jgi:F-type H+-transporting ATPase subunit delta
MQTTHHTPTVLSYATSLLELAEEQNQTGPISEELGQIEEIIQNNPNFGLYLADPSISHEERSKVLTSIFGGKVSPLLWNFLGVLNLKGRLALLPQIMAAFEDLMDDKHSKIEVDITVAHKLSPEDLEDVRKRISIALKKDAVVHQYVDESILGGIILRVQDQLIDGSVKQQLKSINESIMKQAPR